MLCRGIKAKKNPGQAGRRTGEKERLNWEPNTHKDPQDGAGSFSPSLTRQTGGLGSSNTDAN